MPGKILVTPRSVTKGGHPSLDKLEKAGYELVFCTPGIQPGEDELKKLLPGCIGYLAGVETISCEVLKHAGKLKVVSRNGTGINNIDMATAKELGIVVRRAEGANARGVAELAMGLILASVRSIPFSDAAIKKCGWERRNGIELENRTLGIVGFGKIGRIVANFAAAFGMKIFFYDPFPPRDFKEKENLRSSTLEEIFRNSDIITLHCPAGEKPLLGKDEIAGMRKGVYIVNTARAELVDDKAIIAAVESGHVSGFATDVFAPEPPKDFTLAQNNAVIATPHIGGLTKESVDRAMNDAVDNLLDTLRDL